MTKIDNLNIEAIETLPSPEAVRGELPLSAAAAAAVVAGRDAVRDILDRKDRRHLMIVGPCSVHSMDGALAYAERVKELSDDVADRILIVMRTYFEKPRTTVGWKGFIYDPGLDGSCDIATGLRQARQILLEIAALGLPTATEILEPVIPQYITDLVSWAAIGARTTESQTHRQLASGLSMPIGFKNSTDGSLKVAVEAIRTAASQHAFIGITGQGRVGVFRTLGNAYGHLVLRGGLAGTNYGSEHVAFARELMRKADLTPNVIIDCSHANSRKIPKNQITVLRDVLSQLRDGASDIVGTMLESNLLSGSQDITSGNEVVEGLSVTDACIGWDLTEALVREAHGALASIDR